MESIESGEMKKLPSPPRSNTVAVVPVGRSQNEIQAMERAVSNDADDDEFEVLTRRETSLKVREKAPGGSVIKVKTKEIIIDKAKYQVDAHQLMRMIRYITQSIGEYKDANHVYSAFVIGALRKARSDMASVLENEFHIHWTLEDGQSIFYLG